MINNKILLLMLCMVFLVGSVNAETFKQSTEVDLKIVCINNGFCSSSSVCNVSVFSPNEVTLLSGVQATRESTIGAYHNITINSSSTSQLGKYSVGGFCKDGSVAEEIDFNFDVTADGKPFEAFPNQFAAILLSFILIMFGLFKERFNMLKHMGSILLMIMGILTLYPGYNFINHTTLFGLALGSILVGIGFYFLIEDSFSRGDQEETYDQEEEFV